MPGCNSDAGSRRTDTRASQQKRECSRRLSPHGHRFAPRTRAPARRAGSPAPRCHCTRRPPGHGGRPARRCGRELAALATEVDLVVMTTHGRAGLPGWLAGERGRPPPRAGHHSAPPRADRQARDIHDLTQRAKDTARTLGGDAPVTASRRGVLLPQRDHSPEDASEETRKRSLTVISKPGSTSPPVSFSSGPSSRAVPSGQYTVTVRLFGQSTQTSRTPAPR
jgi:hypothetical protein